MTTNQESSEALTLSRIIRQKLTGLHNKLSGVDSLFLAEISLKETIRETINVHNQQIKQLLGLTGGSAAPPAFPETRKLRKKPPITTEQLYLILNELSAILVLESKLEAVLDEINQKHRVAGGDRLLAEQKRIIKLIFERLASYEKFTKAK